MVSKKSLVALLVFFAVFASGAFQRVHAQAANLIHASSFSKYMGNKQWEFAIYLPPSYSTSPTKRYPVIYSLHGMSADENQFTYYATTFVHSYILQNKVPEVIVVFPNGGGTTFFMDSGVFQSQSQNADSYITKELIPHIDSTYRTIADRKSRAISGMSMGGFGTFHLAFKYPQLFCSAGPFSAGGPYIGNTLITNYSAAEDPHKLAVSNDSLLKKEMRVYISVGGTDGLMPYSQDLANICKAQNIPYVFNVVPNVGHDFNGELLQDGLQSTQYITEGFNPVSIEVPVSTGPSNRNENSIMLVGNTLHVGSVQPVLIELFSISGKLIGAYRTSERIAKLDLSHFTRGTYCVRLQSTSGTIEKKIFLN